ncbi:MAG: transcriptional repressor [Acidimicrobiia bacterium]|nr:transcriptional repressor [Acidimicrobiia bacterium]
MKTAQADRAEQAVAELLADEGLRFTPARRLVVRALADAPGPLTTGDLHTALRSRLPLSSLYRTLTVLAAARVLAREHDGGGVARYELAEWLTGHHHHLVCLVCGEVRDVSIDPQTEGTIAALVERIAGGAGFEATGHRIDIEGKCAACRRR